MKRMEIALLFFLTMSVSSLAQKTQQTRPAARTKAAAAGSAAITPGTYACWLNDMTSPGGMRLLGEMFVKGNTYGGPLLGKGTYTFTPSSKMVSFSGGGFDQRKNGEEWVGIFYKKGETLLDGSGRKAFKTMLVIKRRKEWEGGKKMAWLQQCELK